MSVIDESENYIKYLDTFKIAFDSHIDEKYIFIKNSILFSLLTLF